MSLGRVRKASRPFRHCESLEGAIQDGVVEDHVEGYWVQVAWDALLWVLPLSALIGSGTVALSYGEVSLEGAGLLGIDLVLSVMTTVQQILTLHLFSRMNRTRLLALGYSLLLGPTLFAVSVSAVRRDVPAQISLSALRSVMVWFTSVLIINGSRLTPSRQQSGALWTTMYVTLLWEVRTSLLLTS